VEKLHDFEEENVEDLFREKENVHQASNDERIRLTTERFVFLIHCPLHFCCLPGLGPNP
jgi:hypothetical protein